tara:strand:+ start:238 stop:534 length:297 start_codon:yes stop_codon:yes gene_type:complete
MSERLRAAQRAYRRLRDLQVVFGESKSFYSLKDEYAIERIQEAMTAIDMIVARYEPVEIELPFDAFYDDEGDGQFTVSQVRIVMDGQTVFDSTTEESE